MPKENGIYLNHQVAQVWGINKRLLNNPNRLMKVTLQLAEYLKLKIINSYIHKFEPYGLSLVLIIAESHLAIHTWPEYQYMHIDIVSCSKKADLSGLEEVLNKHFKPDKIVCQQIKYN